MTQTLMLAVFSMLLVSVATAQAADPPKSPAPAKSAAPAKAQRAVIKTEGDARDDRRYGTSTGLPSTSST